MSKIHKFRRVILDICTEIFEALRSPAIDRLKANNRDDCPIMHKVAIIGQDGKKYWIWAMPDPLETGCNAIYEATKVARTDLRAAALDQMIKEAKSEYIGDNIDGEHG
jgi:hypothetical protein